MNSLMMTPSVFKPQLLTLSLLLLLTGCAGQVKQPLALTEPVVAPDVMAMYETALDYMHDDSTLEQSKALLQALSQSHPELSGPPVNLGHIAMQEEDYSSAKGWYQKALSANAGNIDAHIQLGILYRKTGAFTQALEAYQKALRIDPNHSLANYNMAVLYDLYLQEPERAIGYYEKYLNVETDIKVAAWVKDLKRQVN